MRNSNFSNSRPIVNSRKRTSSGGNKIKQKNIVDQNFNSHWREALGPAPHFGVSKTEKLAWLIFMKKKWIYQRRQNEERRKAFARGGEETNGFLNNNISKRPAAVGIAGFVQKGARALSELPWQIIQIMETGELGLFNLWILVENDIRFVKLRVPRIFYINSKFAKEESNNKSYKKVNRILPRGNPVYNLYRYEVPEDKFQEHINELTTELSAPEIEGIYETQVPLLFRVLVELGSVCRLKSEHRKSYLETETFDLNQLEFLSLSMDCEYLEKDCFKHLFLYHYSQDTLAIWALFIVPSKKVDVWIVDKGKNNSVPNLTNLYNLERQTKLQKFNETSKIPEADYQFHITFCTNVKDVYKNLQVSVRKYKDEKRGATILSFVSPHETDSLIHLMPGLMDFPMIKLRTGQQENMFSVLDWQRVGCRSMIVQFLNFQIHFQNYTDVCRYLRIPVGNVPKDCAIFGADLFFARNLLHQNHVLWCSPSERPDFGGKELDDNRLVTDFFEPQDLNLNQPGFYSCYCVELEVASLPIAALLQSQKISEEEGISSAVGFDVGQQQIGIDEMVSNQNGARILASYDESSLCAYTFRCLKAVVRDWVRDVANFSNKYADSLIVHFYRWLRNSRSLMYEPALKKILNALMKKLFLLLIADLKRLGAIIVHATLSKVIISTKKLTQQDALAYVNFILASVNKKDLYSPLDITIKESWRVLLWMDPANFGGIKVDSSNSSDELTQSQDEAVVDMNWNLMQFLPDIYECRANFDNLIGSYIYLVYQQIRQEFNAPLALSNSDDLNVSGLNATLTVVKNDKINENLATFCQNLIANEFTQRLVGFVQKLQRRLQSNAGVVELTEIFPLFPGSHLNMKNPSLEFSKTICKVISLDSNVENEVENLKRILLKTIEVGEFSAEAEWVDPCLSYVLPEVICKFCNHCRDVDLCRDQFLFMQDSKKLTVWRCSRCNREYDVAEIEQILLQHLNKWLISYSLQDLKCIKCNMIKQCHMNSRCECSGNFTTLLTLDDLRSHLRAFLNIARLYSMIQLEEALKFVTRFNPQLKLC